MIIVMLVAAIWKGKVAENVDIWYAQFGRTFEVYNT